MKEACKSVILCMLWALSSLHCGQHEKQSAEKAALVGAWKSNVQFETGSFATIKDLQFLYVFNEGGTMTESSNYDAAPPVPPAYGIWKALDRQQFEVRYEFFVTRPAMPEEAETASGGWLPAGHGLLVETITISADGNSFTSNIRYEMFDKAGTPVAGGGTAKARGKRLVFR